MDEPDRRVAELSEHAVQLRVRAIEAHRALIDELAGVWNELNEFAVGRPDVRRTCDQIAGDIARLEKLDLAFDTEWLAEVKRGRA